MKFSRNITSPSTCFKLTTVAVLAVTGIVMALKYAYYSNPANKKKRKYTSGLLHEDLREKVRTHAGNLLNQDQKNDLVRHTIKSHIPKSRQLPPQDYDPQF